MLKHPDYEFHLRLTLFFYQAEDGIRDLTVTGVQTCALPIFERGGQWTKGKGCETFGPLGPWLVTKDEVKNVKTLDMWLDVNGEKRQRGNTKTMIFDIPHIVWYCSQFFVMEPGDVITTGTPPGVGLGMKPPTF